MNGGKGGGGGVEQIVKKIPHNVSQVLHRHTGTVKTAWI